jgi:hypothetical protein
MRALSVLLAAALVACSPATLVGLPASPQVAADRTTLDEQALLGVELAYKAARIAVEVYVDSGHCTGACATRFRDLNRRAYAAVNAARAAYRAGNATGYIAALGEARTLANDLLSVTGRNS